MDSLVERINAINPAELEEWSRHVMVGGGTPGPTIVRAKGVRVQDYEGKSYIDCTSQSWAMILGFGHEDILRAVSDQMQHLTHIHQGFGTLTRLYLAHVLAQIAPGGMNRIAFNVGGAPAIEAAMKIALKNRPGAKNFIALYDAYHGTTLATMSLSWLSTRAKGRFLGSRHFMPVLQNVTRVPNPYCYRCIFGQQPETCDLMCARMLRHTLERGINGPAAGFILEPVQGSAGQIPLPKRYLEEVRRICDEFEVPLIFDEIQTYCRIGKFFGAEHYGVTPDIIVLGKSLGAGLPISCILIRDGLEGFYGPDWEDGATFANNTLAQVAASKQIEVIQRDKLLENCVAMGEQLRNGILRLREEFPEIGDVRQVGLHIGVEFVADLVAKAPLNKETPAIRQEGMKRGVLFGLGGVRPNVLKVKPPMIIHRDEVDEVLGVLEASMRAVLRT